MHFKGFSHAVYNFQFVFFKTFSISMCWKKYLNVSCFSVFLSFFKYSYFSVLFYLKYDVNIVLTRTMQNNFVSDIGPHIYIDHWPDRTSKPGSCCLNFSVLCCLLITVVCIFLSNVVVYWISTYEFECHSVSFASLMYDMT